MKYYFSKINVFLDVISKKGFPFVWKSNPDYFVIKNLFDKYIFLDLNTILNIKPLTDKKDYKKIINELTNKSIVRNFYSRLFYNEYEHIDLAPSGFNSGIIIGIDDIYFDVSYVSQLKCHFFDCAKLFNALSEHNSIDDFISDFFEKIINDESFFSKSDNCLVQYTDKENFIESFFVNNSYIKYNWNFCSRSDGFLREWHFLQSIIILNNHKITQSNLADILSFYDIYFDCNSIIIKP